MFSFMTKKHKYTAYRNKKGDNNYVMESDDDESQSFLVGDLEDVPSDAHIEHTADSNSKNDEFVFEFPEFPDPEIDEERDSNKNKKIEKGAKIEEKLKKKEPKKQNFMQRVINSIKNRRTKKTKGT